MKGKDDETRRRERAKTGWEHGPIRTASQGLVGRLERSSF